MARVALTEGIQTIPATGLNITDMTVQTLSTGAGNGVEVPYQLGTYLLLRNDTGGSAAFTLKVYRLLVFGSLDELAQATEEGWFGDFQKGMRNADGSPRRAKYKVRMDRIPREYLGC